MSEVLLLSVLLAAAYFGNLFVEGRSIRGFGLPSGAEWLVVGVILGPHALGVFQVSVIRDLEPLVVVGLGWTALVLGIDYGYVGDRRSSRRGLLLGLALSLLCAAVVAAAAFAYCTLQLRLAASEALVVAATLALVSSETTRHAVRWISERQGAQGPLADILAEIADADGALPLLGLGVLVAISTTAGLNVELPLGWRLAAAVALAVILGLIAAALLARSFAFGESWAVLIGVALLGIGISMRLGAAALTVMFICGVVISMLSHRHAELRRLLAPTERPVILPLLVLGGATLDLRSFSPVVIGLLGVVLLARIVAKLAGARLIAAFVPAARHSPGATGGALLASGTLSMSIGLYAYLSLEGRHGELALLAASVATAFGELVGPIMLRRALSRAGEIEGSDAVLPALPEGPP
ncbi:MAG TPA: potassium transporter Kef [Polyangiaceae bacterium]|nr:potassium transporter Kef [Polyangiaceae bacterium]